MNHEDTNSATGAQPAAEARIPANRLWKTITLRESYGPDITEFDVGEAGESVGDYSHYRDPLENPTTRARVGTIHVTCIFAYANECEGSLLLKGRGQIAFDGISPYGSDPDRFAIVGGTGEFADVGGVMELTFPEENMALLTLKLTH